MKKHRFLIEKCPRISVYDCIKQAGFNRRAYRPFQGSTLMVSAVIDGYPLKEVVLLTHSKTNFNGFRVWFCCPGCSKRIRDLYITKDLHSWQCRCCHDLTYSSQRRHKNWMYETIDKYDIRQGRIEKKLTNKYLRTPTKLSLMLEFRILTKVALQKFNQHFSEKFGK